MSAKAAGFVSVVVSLIVSACVGTATTLQPESQQSQAESPGRNKILNVGVTGAVEAMSIAGASTPTGGWVPLTEIHTDSLVTSEFDSRKPIGRLAERVPSVDDGSVSVLPDGRMRVVFNLRKGVTWHDGTPFTADDLVFSYELGGPSGIPFSGNIAVRHMASVEATDESTFVIYYKRPYYLGMLPGPPMFYPLPRHILNDAYQQYLASNNADDVLNQPYWTSGYMHLGAFRMTEFDPGQSFTFEAYNQYYLRRPKIDTIHVHLFGDQNTLLASIMSGAIDLVPELALREPTGTPLRDAWTSSGDGTVYVRAGPLRRMTPQFRPSLQMEPDVLNPRVRAAFYHALDREELAEAVGGGNRHLTAWAILPPSDPNFEAVRDTLRPLAYDPDRARAILREAGWTVGAAGALRHSSDGRPFRTSIWGSSDAGREIAAHAGYLRAIGMEVDEFTIAPAHTRNREYRAQFPGWELTARDFLADMRGVAASPENRWTGNRSGFEDARAQQLAAAFEASISPSEQLQRMRAINDYYLSELSSIFTFANPTYLAARKGVKAYQDMAGGDNWEYYGSYYRNVYLWDME